MIDIYMKNNPFRYLYLLFLLLIPFSALGQTAKFKVDGTHFTMGGKPYQIMSGGIHFQRIPQAYWKERLLEAKAMGLNTVATYVFWDEVEPRRGQWDFTGRNNLRKFIKLAQQVGLNVLLRPGPYVCAEWDFGGLPAWLLKIPDIKVRSSDPRYMKAVKSYIAAISRQIKGLQNPGGPVIMLQIENEYGSYGNDKSYLKQLAKWWRKDGIHVPFYTADGASKSMLKAGSIPGAVVGIESALSKKQYQLASKIWPDVPVFCSECYSGWLTHWRSKKWAHTSATSLAESVNWLMEHHKSFNLYVFNGGTNFGFMAGTNYGKHYEPDVTSYDYDAPLNEMGQPTTKYDAIRRTIAKYLPDSKKLPPVPSGPTVITIPPVHFTRKTSIWNHLPKPKHVAQPKPMAAFGQYHGYILYRTKLLGVTHGKLKVLDLHDFATVFLDGKFIGTIDRSLGENSIKIPKTDDPNPTLDILVEAMGRINYGPRIIDRKGITKRVQLGYMTLMNWKVYNIPMDSSWVQNMSFKNDKADRAGTFFKAHFSLDKVGSTYLDMSKWKKGFVWVNGHNLGRFWEVGPQYRLYCPGVWLHKGKNTIIVFDMLQKKPAAISGKKKLK
jgi:beta-galactosidase